MRKLLGFLALLLGLVGFLASLAGVIGTWWLRTPATDTALETLAALHEALQTGGERLGQARAAVGTIHEAVEPAAKRVARLAVVAGDTTPEEDKEIERQRNELLRKLDQLEGYVQMGQTVVDMLNRANKGVKKLPLLGKRADSAITQAQDANSTLSELSEFLKSLGATLNTIRTDKKVRQEMAEKAGAIATEIETRLKRLEERIRGAEEEINAAKTEVAEARAELPTWSLWAAIALSVFLVWFGLGQWALLCTGLRWLRGTPVS